MEDYPICVDTYIDITTHSSGYLNLRRCSLHLLRGLRIDGEL